MNLGNTVLNKENARVLRSNIFKNKFIAIFRHNQHSSTCDTEKDFENEETFELGFSDPILNPNPKLPLLQYLHSETYPQQDFSNQTITQAIHFMDEIHIQINVANPKPI